MSTTTAHQVLLVEDDPVIARTLVMSLRYEQFELSVADNLARARALCEQQQFDLVLLDVGLPDGNGIDLCRDLRARDAGLPILMLSARTDEATAVAGIEGGADDYIRKPYGLRELCARMRRLLDARRPERQQAAYANLCLDPQRRTATVAGVAISLGKKEYDMLLLLVKANGDTVSRELILDRLDFDQAIYDRTIDSHLSHLRRKLKDAGAALRIAAIYGIGYRLEAL